MKKNYVRFLTMEAYSFWGINTQVQKSVSQMWCYTATRPIEKENTDRSYILYILIANEMKIKKLLAYVLYSSVLHFSQQRESTYKSEK